MTTIHPTAPMETTQSIELGIRNVEYAFSRSIKTFDDWSPEMDPFPTGKGPHQYKSYKVGNVNYRIGIPRWGKDLPIDQWYYGKFGLFNLKFDSKPYFLGDFNEAFFKKRYNDKYYFIEVTHRLWAIGDRVLTPTELEVEFIDHPWYPEPVPNTDRAFMEFRRQRYLDNRKEDFKSSFIEFRPKTEVLAKSDPLSTRKTKDEILRIVRRKGFPEPIYKTFTVKRKTKLYWVNEPNPKFIKRQVTDKPPIPPPNASLKRKRTRTSKLKTRFFTERSFLTRSLCIGNASSVRLYDLRELRNAERHLLNIINLSESLKVIDLDSVRFVKKEIYRLIGVIPFKGFFNKKVLHGSIMTLPDWARRIIVKNLHCRYL